MVDSPQDTVKYCIILDDATKKQLKLLSKNTKLFARMLVIFKDIENNPYSPAFKFERLKHNLSGFCSKRLDQKKSYHIFGGR
ncbi:MAG: type II toxin-antitoxin system YoeB family toxin [candidate division SR1 bacterium]|nr:type II toxin-antitoxin system YoeB family toxin [candidate division SR1 bacterium]